MLKPQNREDLQRLLRSSIAIDRAWSNESEGSPQCSRESRTAWESFRRKKANILDQKQPFSMGIFYFFAAEKRTLFLGRGGGITSKLANQWLSCGAYISMPQPLLAQITCVILRKRWAQKTLFLGRQACTLYSIHVTRFSGPLPNTAFF